MQGHGSIFIIFFESVVVTIGAEVFAARESVQPYQWVHVVTTGSGTVLDFLSHQVYVGVQGQAVIEQRSRFAESDIVLLQLIHIDYAFGGRVGV